MEAKQESSDDLMLSNSKNNSSNSITESYAHDMSIPMGSGAMGNNCHHHNNVVISPSHAHHHHQHQAVAHHHQQYTQQPHTNNAQSFQQENIGVTTHAPKLSVNDATRLMRAMGRETFRRWSTAYTKGEAMESAEELLELVDVLGDEEFRALVQIQLPNDGEGEGGGQQQCSALRNDGVGGGVGSSSSMISTHHISREGTSSYRSIASPYHHRAGHLEERSSVEILSPNTTPTNNSVVGGVGLSTGPSTATPQSQQHLFQSQQHQYHHHHHYPTSRFNSATTSHAGLPQQQHQLLASGQMGDDRSGGYDSDGGDYYSGLGRHDLAGTAASSSSGSAGHSLSHHARHQHYGGVTIEQHQPMALLPQNPIEDDEGDNDDAAADSKGIIASQLSQLPQQRQKSAVVATAPSSAVPQLRKVPHNNWSARERHALYRFVSEEKNRPAGGGVLGGGKMGTRVLTRNAIAACPELRGRGESSVFAKLRWMGRVTPEAVRNWLTKTAATTD